jgi:hypothetical protein
MSEAPLATHACIVMRHLIHTCVYRPVYTRFVFFSFGAYACVSKLCFRQLNVATVTFTSHCFTIEISYRLLNICIPYALCLSVLCFAPRCAGEYSLSGRNKEYSS